MKRQTFAMMLLAVLFVIVSAMGPPGPKNQLEQNKNCIFQSAVMSFEASATTAQVTYDFKMVSYPITTYTLVASWGYEWVSGVNIRGSYLLVNTLTSPLIAYTTSWRNGLVSNTTYTFANLLYKTTSHETLTANRALILVYQPDWPIYMASLT